MPQGSKVEYYTTREKHESWLTVQKHVIVIYVSVAHGRFQAKLRQAIQGIKS